MRFELASGGAKLAGPRGRKASPVRGLGQKAEPAPQLREDQELVVHPALTLATERRPTLGIREHFREGRGDGVGILCVVMQASIDAITDLLSDAAGG